MKALGLRNITWMRPGEFCQPFWMSTSNLVHLWASRASAGRLPQVRKVAAGAENASDTKRQAASMLALSVTPSSLPVCKRGLHSECGYRKPVVARGAPLREANWTHTARLGN